MSDADTPATHRAGVLLHPTSLPGARTRGALGAGADAFVDFLAAAGFRAWQMLPLGPVHRDRSPYRALSLFAGGEHLIGIDRLRAEPWLRHGGGAGRPPTRAAFLRAAARDFFRHASAGEHDALRAFAERERDWLEPCCAFRVLRRRFRHAPWQHWPSIWRDDPGGAFDRLRGEGRDELRRELFVQYAFDRQWSALRRRAADAGIALFGDVPIYPAPDSADVWARPDLFRLDAHGHPSLVAGVPPDAFAAQGQGWDCPVYDWPRHAAEGFAWWRRRLAVQGGRFDLLRLDHFRGFEAGWAFPAGATPADGQWYPGPGAALFEALAETPDLPALVAEDLGTITPAVEALRRRFGLPGTRVLQFAFDGDPANPHLPRNHDEREVACTGTHDTDTLAGWWDSLDPRFRADARRALGLPDGAGPEALRAALLDSPARLAVLPMQDVLLLGSAARMNTPGRPTGQWRWRLRHGQVDARLARRMRALLRDRGRLSPG